jgi:mono/diheme cytochrome c family protein
MRAAGLLLMLAVALPAAAGQVCVDCHGGAPQRSYDLSKHGVIARIEAGRKRQRTPLCEGCHTLEAGARAPQHYSKDGAREQARQQAVAGCGSCHSPRYVAEQLAASGRALAIGEMKLKEARAAADAARGELPPEAFARVEALLARMRDEDLRDLRLGLGHQSPDYQWWLGQAALDGSLLRIKGALGEARRMRQASAEEGR